MSSVETLAVPAPADANLVKEFLADRAVLFGFVFAMTGDHHVAEEVFQEIGVTVMDESRRGTRPVDFRAWIRQLARNRVADHYRRVARERGRRSELEELSEVAARAFEENEAAIGDNRERVRALADCAGKLPDRAREVIERRYTDRMNLAEIAAALSWKEASVKTALFRARRALADCIRNKLRLQGSR
jgi:RNA polymerase sigma-70 factor (ECF subfamily)